MINHQVCELYRWYVTPLFFINPNRGIHEKGSGDVVSAVCYTIYTIYLSLCTQKAETISPKPFSRFFFYCLNLFILINKANESMVKWQNPLFGKWTFIKYTFYPQTGKKLYPLGSKNVLLKNRLFYEKKVWLLSGMWNIIFWQMTHYPLWKEITILWNISQKITDIFCEPSPPLLPLHFTRSKNAHFALVLLFLFRWVNM